MSKKIAPTLEQMEALKALHTQDNIFLTGAAGTGKSFVISEYLKSIQHKPAILASTGTAAILVRGCTFHSFFGLGIMKDGVEKTVERAVKNSRVRKRIEDTAEIVIDEVSMIDPLAFQAADEICRLLLDYDKAFGGLRVLAVGDFFQLPPVHKGFEKTWLFQSPIWKNLHFRTLELKTIMRTKDEDFMRMLSYIREGQCPKEVNDYFSQKRLKTLKNFEGTVLFGRKNKVEDFNQKKLDLLDQEEVSYHTEVHLPKSSNLTKEKALQSSPVATEIKLKVGALVMIRKNHMHNLYVNGTLGHIIELKTDFIKIKALNGLMIELDKTSFEILNADGKVQATLTNFPISLAWASTIHKAQGASIDRIFVDMGGLWESGQAYVALSRARDSKELYVHNWDPKFIKSDPVVCDFYRA